jgi:hypothetical protein
LKDQYLVSEINLKHQEDGTLVADKIVKFQGDGTSRRSQLLYKSAMEIQNNIFLSVNIVLVGLLAQSQRYSTIEEEEACQL